MAVKNKIFIPTLISSVSYQPVRTLPHIYFYNGLKDCEDYYIQHYPTGSTTSVTESVQNQFPYLDYYDGLTPTTGSNSLLFFNEGTPYGVVPTGSLYTQYWDKYVSLLYNPRTRLINASAIIPLADYFEMELNDIVQWRGNYYHLRAINDYNLKDGTCKLQLLGPIIRDSAPTDTFDCTFNFSSSLAGIIPTTTTTTIAGTTTTIAPTTTTTIAPTTSTTLAPTTSTSTTTTTTIPPTTTLGPYEVSFLLVGAGGGGGADAGGGGGAGGYITGTYNATPGDTYSIVVGAGGANGTTGVNGSSGSISTVFTSTAYGGGGGGSTGNVGSNGASGGGGGYGTGGLITSGGVGTQGNDGGTGNTNCTGGGGGASQDGQNGTPGTATTALSGDGGNGTQWLNGVYYAGGGGGGDVNATPGRPSAAGTGGIGGGGDAVLDGPGESGDANTGGGGGGGSNQDAGGQIGGSGGSGIVIIRYAGAQRGTGGTVVTTGGFTYHTFNSSGTYTG